MAKKNSRPNLAARKSASKKAEEKKIAQQKAYWEAHKKQILIIAAVAVAAIVLLSLAIDYFYVPSNTVRSFMGNLIDVKENALIREIDDRYYELGTVEIPAGYAPSDYDMSILSDENETFFYYEATEEGKAIDNAYIVGVKDRKAADMLEMISGSFNYEEQTENTQVSIGGHDVHYFYAKSLQNETVPDVYIATITSYIDTIKDSCVLVSLTSPAGAIDELPTVEEMMAEAEAVYASVTTSK